MKICKDCKTEKHKSEFYGVQGECKECTKKRVNEHSKKTGYDKYRQKYSLKRIFNHRYRGMKQRVDGKGTRKYSVENKELCTREEFIKWCNEKENLNIFKKLHEEWKKDNFSRMSTPSINRIDDNKGYSIENIEWVSLRDNIKKYKQNGFINSNFYRERDKQGRFKKHG